MAKRVLITGASSGIGEALAIEWNSRFPEDTIFIAARNSDKLKTLASKSAKFRTISLDLASPPSIERTAKELQLDGALDLVIHNAGISQRSLTKETTIDVDRSIMETNYFGTVYLTKLLLPAMLAKKSGHFAVVTSLVGKFGSPMRSGYAGSKHALHGFFDSFRAEIAKDGVRVTMVCPGFIRTQISFSALTADGSKQDKMDDAQEHGMDPAVCAQKIISGILGSKREIYVGGREVLGVYVSSYFPNIFAKILQKAKVT